MRAEPTRQERFAAEVIRRIGGWECTYADAETSGAIDWWLVKNEVRAGGVEVTILGDQKALQTHSAAGPTYWDLPTAKWAWMLSYSASTNFKEVHQHLETLVLLCEKHGVVEPGRLPWAVSRDSPAVRWFDERSGCSLYGFPESSRHGVVDVVPEGSGGAVFTEAEPLVDWIEAELRGRLARKIRRFDEVSGAERHLFVVVHDSGVSFDLFYALATTHSVPTREPELPMGLTGLWLLPTLGHSVLWWHRGAGWRRADYDAE